MTRFDRFDMGNFGHSVRLWATCLDTTPTLQTVESFLATCTVKRPTRNQLAELLVQAEYAYNYGRTREDYSIASQLDADEWDSAFRKLSAVSSPSQES